MRASSAGFPAALILPSRRCWIHEAIGDQLACVFVDTGLMRQNIQGIGEGEEDRAPVPDSYNIPLIHVQAEDLFSASSPGVDDPEKSARSLAPTFIDVFEKEANKNRRRGVVSGAGHALPGCH
ncbi:MAG: hypothetical protein R3C40_10290 [Parvularculaceae bacterium]